MDTLDHNLPDNVEALKGIVIKSHQEIVRLREDIAYLEELVRLFRNQKYAPKSEANRHPGEQLLFNEAELDAEEMVRVESEVTSSESDPQRRTREKPVRKPLPERIPRVERIIDLPEKDKFCAISGHALHRIGEEVTEQLDIIPATVRVIRTIRPKYACSCGACAPRSMPIPPQPIPRSMAAPGLLAFIATAKYADAMPLYRQEGIIQRIGCDIPRATLASWMIRCGELVTPILNLLRDHLLEGPLVFCDETPVQVLKGTGKKPTSKSYMWVTARWDDEGRKTILYEYSPSRGSEVPLRIFQGYKGYVHTDGYEGYSQLSLVPGIVQVGDWVHVRRKFVEAIKGRKTGSKDGIAQHAIDTIKELYKIEDSCAGLSPLDHLEKRQTHSKQLLNELRLWLDSSLGKVPPKSLTGKALAYMDNQWPKLIRFLEDPVIGLDTNVVENAIRPFAVGRKNWLFSDTKHGAQSSAALYSLISTARANEVEPYGYLAHLFTELPKAATVDEFEALLPWNFKRSA